MSAPLRIGVNLLWLVPGVVGGSEESTTRALRAVADLAPDDLELVLFGQSSLRRAHPDLVERFETHTIPIPGGNKALRVVAERLWLRRALARRHIDVLHDAGGTSAGEVDLPRVLTIHDIQPLELPRNFNPVRVAYLRRAVPRAVAAATTVVVPSEFVRSRLVEVLGVPADKIQVVPWSLPSHEPARRIETVRARWGIIGQIVLMPAITYPHKEHVVALRAMAHLGDRHKETTLVLTGGEGPAEREVMAEIHRLGLEDKVVRTGRIPAPALSALYEHAAVVLHPSIYEGFGNTVLEAMASAVPVIVADAGAAPEVVGEAGARFAPGDDVQLAIEIHRMLEDPEWRRRKIEDGLDRARAFTPERTAEGLVAAYRSVVVRQ